MEPMRQRVSRSKWTRYKAMDRLLRTAGYLGEAWGELKVEAECPLAR